MKNKVLVLIIDRVKIKYLECDDIEFRKYIGRVIAGDIDLMDSKIIENSKNNGGIQ